MRCSGRWMLIRPLGVWKTGTRPRSLSEPEPESFSSLHPIPARYSHTGPCPDGSSGKRVSLDRSVGDESILPSVLDCLGVVGICSPAHDLARAAIGRPRHLTGGYAGRHRWSVLGGRGVDYRRATLARICTDPLGAPCALAPSLHRLGMDSRLPDPFPALTSFVVRKRVNTIGRVETHARQLRRAPGSCGVDARIPSGHDAGVRSPSTPTREDPSASRPGQESGGAPVSPPSISLLLGPCAGRLDSRGRGAAFVRGGSPGTDRGASVRDPPDSRGGRAPPRAFMTLQA